MTSSKLSWHFDSNSGLVGPVSAETLREMIRDGRMDPKQAVWTLTNDSRRFVLAEEAVSGDSDEANVEYIEADFDNPPSMPPVL